MGNCWVINMETLWFAIVAFMIAAYVVLDGFDLVAGVIYPIAARNAAFACLTRGTGEGPLPLGAITQMKAGFSGARMLPINHHPNRGHD